VRGAGGRRHLLPLVLVAFARDEAADGAEVGPAEGAVLETARTASCRAGALGRRMRGGAGAATLLGGAAHLEDFGWGEVGAELGVVCKDPFALVVSRRGLHAFLSN
jgi:hypothetical protein